MNAIAASSCDAATYESLGCSSADCGDLPDRGIVNLVDEENWTILTKRLIAYTHMRLARYGAYAGRYTNRAEDYAQEAIVRLMEGTRQFASEKPKDLFRFLCGVVDSLVSHDAEKAKRRGIQLVISNEHGEEAGEVDEEHLSSGEDLENRIIVKNELERFMASLDPALEQYVRLRAAGALRTTRAYAEALNTTVEDVRNMDKRLRRRRKEF